MKLADKIQEISDVAQKLVDSNECKYDWMGTMSGLQMYDLFLKQMKKLVDEALGE